MVVRPSEVHFIKVSSVEVVTIISAFLVAGPSRRTRRLFLLLLVVVVEEALFGLFFISFISMLAIGFVLGHSQEGVVGRLKGLHVVVVVAGVIAGRSPLLLLLPQARHGLVLHSEVEGGGRCPRSSAAEARGGGVRLDTASLVLLSFLALARRVVEVARPRRVDAVHDRSELAHRHGVGVGAHPRGRVIVVAVVQLVAARTLLLVVLPPNSSSSSSNNAT